MSSRLAYDVDEAMTEATGDGISKCEAAIATVLRELMEPGKVVISAGGIMQEDNAIKFRAMIRAFAKEHGIELNDNDKALTWENGNER